MVEFDKMLNYQASVFGHFEDIAPVQNTISKTLDLLGPKGFLPSTFQEITPRGQAIRLRFATADNEWAINIGSERIEVAKNPLPPNGENMGTAEEFSKEVSALMNSLLQAFAKKGNRLSLITKGFLHEMSASKMVEIFKALFIPFGPYQENLPYEWNSRFVMKNDINLEQQETINVITMINRVSGRLFTGLATDINVLGIDRIKVDFDINTFQENKEPRFGIDSLDPFFASANAIRNKILTDLETLF